MKIIFGILFCIFLCAKTEEVHKSSWNEYKEKHKLEFEGPEDDERKNIFEKNVKFIREFNARGDKSYKLAINKFAHLKTEEYVTGMKMRGKKMGGSFVNKPHPNLPVPKSKDWRTYGVVSAVKNQGHCGSCYAFSAIDAIESHEAIRRGFLTVLSEQEIVDCSRKYGNEGCNGGFPESVFEFAMNQDIVTESDYHYLAVNEKCLTKNLTHQGYRLLSYVEIPEGDEALLIRSIGHVGPVSIGIDADHEEFRFYSSGIFHLDHCSSSLLDHAVLAVGYRLVDDGKSYLIVKNSWGNDWGEKGYFRIQLGKNMCGIATMASYPIPKI